MLPVFKRNDDGTWNCQCGLAHPQNHYFCLGCNCGPAYTSDSDTLDVAISALESVLHQLSTDSDLDDKVTAPERYDALEVVVRKALCQIDPTNPQLRWSDFVSGDNR